MATSHDGTIDLVAPKPEQVIVHIEGTTPLIVHRFSEKARRQMLEKQMATTKQKKAPKDPEADYQASMYRLEDGRPGFPAVAFKAAMVGAARQFEGITMTSLKSAVFVLGEGPEQLVPIIGEPQMREDIVRIAMGTTDLRHRAMFTPWAVELVIEYLPTMITARSLLSLVNSAGFGGVGEWRPSAPKSFTGTYGRFHVADGSEAGLS